MDLGTANTVIFQNDQIVLDEPSIVAIDNNTGKAIAPEDQEHIFDRFWRADPAHGRETGGHGLGLAIARTIVDAHRGKIAVDSRESFGTAFTVTLNA